MVDVSDAEVEKSLVTGGFVGLAVIEAMVGMVKVAVVLFVVARPIVVTGTVEASVLVRVLAVVVVALGFTVMVVRVVAVTVVVTVVGSMVVVVGMVVVSTGPFLFSQM